MNTSNFPLFTDVKKIYPDHDSKKYRPIWSYRAKFIVRAIYYWKAYMHLHEKIEPSLLKILSERSQRFLEKPFRPYIIKNSTSMERSEFIVQHYTFVTKQLPTAIKNEIYNTSNGLVLDEFIIDNKKYAFKLAFDGRYQKEGDMSLILCSVDDPTFYTLTFSIRELCGDRQLVIGGLQGPASNADNKIEIKKLTKLLHGQRPKDVMIKIVTIIANVWNIDHLLAVKNKSHIYGSKRYSKGRIKTNYDQHWKELGATEFDQHFYLLKGDDIRRKPEDITRSKRAMYKRRYEWLDNTKNIIESKIKLS